MENLILPGSGISSAKFSDPFFRTLLKAKLPPDQIVALIQANDARFDLAPQNQKALQDAGATQAVLAAIRAKSSAQPSTPLPGVTPAPANPGMPVPPGVNPAPANPGAPPAGGGMAAPTAGASVPEHTLARYTMAKSFVAPPFQPPVIPADCPLGIGKKPARIQLDFDTGSASATRLGKGSKYCFELRNFNSVLYSVSFAVSVPAPTSTPFDLLNDAIQTVTKLATGAAQVAAKPPAPLPGQAACPDLDPVTKASTALKQALAGLDPPKDSGGKVQYVLVSVTVAAWAPVPPAFSTFEKAVMDLITGLPAQPSPGCEAAYAQLEAVILDDYPKLRDRFLTLKANVESQHVKYFETELDNTAPADVKVTAFYNGQESTSGSKTFHFDPTFAIITSSVGFMVTELSSRSYSSATARIRPMQRKHRTCCE